MLLLHAGGNASSLYDNRGICIASKKEAALRRLLGTQPQSHSLTDPRSPSNSLPQSQVAEHQKAPSQGHLQQQPQPVLQGSSQQGSPSTSQGPSQQWPKSQGYSQSPSQSSPGFNSGSGLGSGLESSQQLQTPSPQLQTPPKHPTQMQFNPLHGHSPISSPPWSQPAVMLSRSQSLSQPILHSPLQPISCPHPGPSYPPGASQPGASQHGVMSQHQGMSQQTEVTGTGVFADEEEAGSASRTGVFAHEGSASGSRKRSFGAMLTGTAPLQMLSCCHIHCMQTSLSCRMHSFSKCFSRCS